jgi:hypothetical protein
MLPFRMSSSLTIRRRLNKSGSSSNIARRRLESVAITQIIPRSRRGRWFGRNGTQQGRSGSGRGRIRGRRVLSTTGVDKRKRRERGSTTGRRVRNRNLILCKLRLMSRHR